MKILVLGSGYAGLTAAYKLKKFTDFDITLISKSRVVMENTIFPGLLIGLVDVNDTQFDAAEDSKKEDRVCRGRSPRRSPRVKRGEDK
ncbi:MAG: NAD(P)-binding protein [Candidatus Aramenus sp.]|nr:NAD(P)-binding protein [Candidatus Aramenus sp.]